MGSIRPLTADELYKRCDPDEFTFETTADLEDLKDVLGQERAVASLRFGMGIQHPGYNLFVLGPTGLGKHFTVREFFDRQAATEPVPADWCYINNFADSQKPSTLCLPAGKGAELRDDVAKLVEELRSALPSIFDSEDYRTRKQAVEEEIKERHDKAVEEVRRGAQEKGIGMLRTPTGLVFAPVRKGEVISPEEFEQLPQEDRTRVEEDLAALQQRMQTVMRSFPQWEKEGRDRVKALNREVATLAIAHLMDDLRRKYADLPQAVGYLNALQQDVSGNVDEFLAPPESPLAALISGTSRGGAGQTFFRRYEINLLVDHRSGQGAPVIYEDNPTYQNLVGQAEYSAQLGALVTDFSLIKAGALHRANGGYLILDAYKMLMQPYAWEGLKRALRTSEIRIESVGQMLSLMSTVSLEPEPIPFKVKVILVGERRLYYLLTQLDPDFAALFKVAADFEESVDRNDGNTLLYARRIATFGREEGLVPFDRGAVARIIEHTARVAEDSEKLSTHRRMLTDLLRESDYWARQDSRRVASAEHVQQAIDAQIHRSDRVREHLQEQIQRGTLLIDTEGERVGQVNGLSVLSLGPYSFGHPSRITARVRLGKGEVIDIEREVELGGPIHSKGVLILSGFLGGRYASDQPLSLSASLVFEQSYGGVEGDSASSAELYALLSALAQTPVRQSLAVTGSVNQNGQVQAIGGVNEKIEGFFDVCELKGFAGEHGVLIPASNVRHLMLRRDVVQAAADGRFRIYPVETIDQGIEILTGVPAGERDELGCFPEGTLNHRVEARLMELAEKRATAGAAKPVQVEV
ncbi:MAG TPA: ATP-binding protein [Terriglobia bacterium]|nr:ATP-binding protein [Terriglobia bacterium]